MTRIRTIKPEFPEDEKLGAVSRDARLMFVTMWSSCCDDHGRFRAHPTYLRSTLFPYDEDASMKVVEGWLQELADNGRVNLYHVAGERYGVIANWAKHQRIDNAGKPIYPGPDQADAEPCGDSPRVAASLGEPPLDLDLDQDHDPSSGDSAAFDEWWEQYPRKRGKQAAVKAYKKALKQTNAQTLYDAVAAWIQFEWRDRPLDKIPHPATWLNEGRWEDDLIDDRRATTRNAGDGLNVASNL